MLRCYTHEKLFRTTYHVFTCDNGVFSRRRNVESERFLSFWPIRVFNDSTMLKRSKSIYFQRFGLGTRLRAIRVCSVADWRVVTDKSIRLRQHNIILLLFGYSQYNQYRYIDNCDSGRMGTPSN